MKRARLALVALLCLFAACHGGVDVVVIDHGQFHGVHLVRSRAEVNGTVLLASDAQGWDDRAQRTAATLARAGALVVGIDTPAFLAKIAKDAPSCVLPAGDFDNLARFSEAYMRLPQYAPSVLAGLGVGASLSVAAQLQATDDTFAGTIALDFCDVLPLRAPLCTEGVLDLRKPPPRQRFAPARKPAAPIYIVGDAQQRSCHGGLDPEYARYAQRGTELLPAYMALAKRASQRAERPPSQLKDLPLVEVPASAEASHADADVFAVVLSGDGGWAGIDRALAGSLSEHGVPCVGLDTLRYFWTARTPAGSAADIARIVQHYRELWHRSRVVLIGFSQGADVLPFIVNRLPAHVRRNLAATIALSISGRASFEFHIANWVSSRTGGLPTMPELRKLADRQLWCVYGSGDDDAICPRLSKTDYHIVQLPGGHHFDGDYGALARVVLQAIEALPTAAAR